MTLRSAPWGTGHAPRAPFAMAVACALAAPAAWAQPAAPGALAPPLGPALSCADFVHNSDKTWSITHAAKVTANGMTMTLWPTTHLGAGVVVSGIDAGSLVDQACGGPSGPPHLPAQPNPVTPPPQPWNTGTPTSARPPPTPPTDGTHGQQVAPPPDQSGSGALAAPLGPGLSCADFVRNADGTWSITHAATIGYDGVSVTLWPTTRIVSGLRIAGQDFGALVRQQCGGGGSQGGGAGGQGGGGGGGGGEGGGQGGGGGSGPPTPPSPGCPTAPPSAPPAPGEPPPRSEAPGASSGSPTSPTTTNQATAGLSAPPNGATYGPPGPT